MDRDYREQDADTNGEEAYAQFLQDRRQWEADESAVAEYESWYLQKTITEFLSEGIAERGEK